MKDGRTPASPELDTLDLTAVRSGTRKAFRLRAAELQDGATLTLPVNIIAGSRPGPTLAAIAGIHGNEVEGIMALLELWEELTPKSMGGVLIIVPVANPPAFATHTRTSPLDGLDLNRIFPGRAAGQPSEQLAHRLYVEVVEKADFLLSMHSWYASGSVLPYVEFGHLFTKTAAKSFEAAAASGFDLVRISHWSPGLLTRVANEAGIPGIEVEIGGLGVSVPGMRERYKSHLLRLLRHLGMLEGGGETPVTPRIVRHMDVTSPAGGILRLIATVGETIDAGARLATLHNLNGTLLDDIKAPEAGLVAAAHEAVSVEPGTHLFRLFQDVNREDVWSGLANERNRSGLSE